MRMGSETPKQFLPLKGKPLVFHTIEKFQGIADEIIVVLPPGFFSNWEKMCHENSFNIQHTVIEGGTTRSLSVSNGLTRITGNGLVAIHDAARPLVSSDLIRKIYAETLQHSTAIPVVPIKDTVRETRDGKTYPVNRDNYLAVQTPQGFLVDKIREAYTFSGGVDYTDDASVFEAAGGVIYTVNGERTNLKITYPEDMLIAEKLLDYQKM